MRLLVHTAYSVCYSTVRTCTVQMFFILCLLQQKIVQKITLNLNDIYYSCVFVQYFKIHVTTMNDTNEYFFLSIVYSKNTNVCQFTLMIDHFE